MSYPHIDIESEDNLLRGDIQAWVDAGQPHMWLKVEESRGFIVKVDVGHGGLRLFKASEQVGNLGTYCASGKTMLSYSHNDENFPFDVVVLDKDDYGVSSYLWFNDKVKTDVKPT